DLSWIRSSAADCGFSLTHLHSNVCSKPSLAATLFLFPSVVKWKLRRHFLSHSTKVRPLGTRLHPKENTPPLVRGCEIDDKPPGSFRKKSARGCMFMGNKQIKEIRFGKLGGSQSLFLSSRGARPFF